MRRQQCKANEGKVGKHCETEIRDMYGSTGEINAVRAREEAATRVSGEQKRTLTTYRKHR